MMRTMISTCAVVAVCAASTSQSTPAHLTEEAVAPEPTTAEAITTIAFGSCFDPARGPSDVWEAVRDFDPDVLLMIGDNVYADTEDMEELRADYAALDAIPAFAEVKNGAHFMATWDDHDFGLNDGGAEFPMRAESQQVLLDWAGEPQNTWRRNTPGVYDVETFGPDGRRVQIILLDTRYFRGPLLRGQSDRDWSDGVAGRYDMAFDSDATMLGEQQWQWLDQVLEQPADLRIIASSIQVVSEDHRYEKWANLPRERTRLFDLIESTAAEGVVFISGDRHRAEISRFDPARATPNTGSFDAYPLWDITSSALNRSSSGVLFEDRFSNEINRHVIGNQYQANNFGSIVIDWNTGELTFTIHRENGEPALVAREQLDALVRGDSRAIGQ